MRIGTQRLRQGFERRIQVAAFGFVGDARLALLKLVVDVVDPAPLVADRARIRRVAAHDDVAHEIEVLLQGWLAEYDHLLERAALHALVHALVRASLRKPRREVVHRLCFLSDAVLIRHPGRKAACVPPIRHADQSANHDRPAWRCTALLNVVS